MKNFSVKKSLAIMVAAAGFSSLFLVMHSAFGLDAPSVNPEGAGGISPTFSGLTLEGDLNFQAGGLAFRNGSRFASGGSVELPEFSLGNAIVSGGSFIAANGISAGQPGANTGVTISKDRRINATGGDLNLSVSNGRSVNFGAANNPNNVTVYGNVSVAGSVLVGGGMDLPFLTSSAVINGNAAGTYPTQTVACPAGTTKAVSCQLYMTTGANLVIGPGTRYRTDGIAGCSGRYYQNAAGNTGGLLTATCL